MSRRTVKVRILPAAPFIFFTLIFMANILLWIGLTAIVALPHLGLSYALIGQVGAILMIVGCILLCIRNPKQ